MATSSSAEDDYRNSITRNSHQMNDLRSYSRQWIKEFIELYKSELCLWKALHPGYNNPIERNKAYDKLVEKLKEVEPNPNRGTVLRKINSLRSAFRRELRKKEHYKDYQSRLWYFDIISFIADQKYPGTEKRKYFLKCMESDSNDEDTLNGIETDSTDAKESTPFATVQTLQIEIQKEKRRSSPQEKSNANISSHDPLDVDVKHVDSYYKPESLTVPIMHSAVHKHDDEYDAIGMNVASKLRAIKPTQRIIAEKLISDILFSAQLEVLTVSSKLST